MPFLTTGGRRLHHRRIERGARGPARRLRLEGCGHLPRRERPEETLAALARLVEEAAA